MDTGRSQSHSPSRSATIKNSQCTLRKTILFQVTEIKKESVHQNISPENPLFFSILGQNSSFITLELAFIFSCVNRSFINFIYLYVFLMYLLHPYSLRI